MRFIETPIFTEDVERDLSVEEYRQLQVALLLRPTQGALIRGSGGLRKIRWGRPGMGKRGVLRAIYFRSRRQRIQSAQDRVKRRGKKKALVAVGHSILVIAYHVLQTRTRYQDLGGDYFERRNVDKQRKRLIRQLESLGVKVTVEEVKEAA